MAPYHVQIFPNPNTYIAPHKIDVEHVQMLKYLVTSTKKNKNFGNNYYLKNKLKIHYNVQIFPTPYSYIPPHKKDFQHIQMLKYLLSPKKYLSGRGK